MPTPMAHHVARKRRIAPSAQVAGTVNRVRKDVPMKLLSATKRAPLWMVTLVGAPMALACAGEPQTTGESAGSSAATGVTTAPTAGGVAPGTQAQATSVAGSAASSGKPAVSAGPTVSATAGSTAPATPSSAAGTSAASGGAMAAAGGGGVGAMPGAGAGGRASPAAGSGTCTASKPATATATGSGPHKVVVELNADPGINEGTIYRPMDLGGEKKFPIFVWGEGGCQQNGTSNLAVMGEIASHGYFIVADGLPSGTGGRGMGSNTVDMGKPLIAYIDWAVAENEKPCSAYYQSLDTTKIASNGFSCGGLMAAGTAGDPRITTWGITSSGLFSADAAFYMTVHTPVLVLLGGPDDIAYENGVRDYDNLAPLGTPIAFFSKNGSNHGGDLMNGTGDFSKINLAWLNWWLKDDLTETGKGLLHGSTCTYCMDSTWEYKSMNIP
jgi:hypothetical protein